MKVIELRIEDWQAEVLARSAARRGLTPEELIRGTAIEMVKQEVDSACRQLFLSDRPRVEIEYRLAALFYR